MTSSNMQIPEASQKFSNLQLELLRMYAHNVSDEELIQVKDFLGKMFLQRLSDQVNKSIEEKNIQQHDFENWLNEQS